MAGSPSRPQLTIDTKATTTPPRYYATHCAASISSASSSPSSCFSAEDFVPSPDTSLESLHKVPHNTPLYADDHYPLIASIWPSEAPASRRNHVALWCARQMAQIHNSFIRAINSSYNHCLAVLPSTQEAADFLLFNQQIALCLDHHHHVEDDYMFPEIEKLLGKPGAMSENVAGHEKFMEAFHVFEKYVTRTTADEYNGLTFRHIIESFAPDLVKHLHAEISTLVALHVVKNERALLKIWKHAEHLATKDADLYLNAPFMLGCQDKEFEIDGERCTFPDMPWAIESMVRNWTSWRHGGAWKYCPSDLQGRRRQIRQY